MDFIILGADGEENSELNLKTDLLYTVSISVVIENNRKESVKSRELKMNWVRTSGRCVHECVKRDSKSEFLSGIHVQIVVAAVFRGILPYPDLKGRYNRFN